MADQRRARFASIDGLEQADIILTGEVWYDDIVKAPWSSREAMKNAAQMLRYLSSNDPRMLSLVLMETQLQLSREEVRRSLSLMQSMNAVESYLMEKDSIVVVMHLSQLQQLRVLEARQRLNALGYTGSGGHSSDRRPAPVAVQMVAPDAPLVETRSAA